MSRSFAIVLHTRIYSVECIHIACRRLIAAKQWQTLGCFNEGSSAAPAAKESASDQGRLLDPPSQNSTVRILTNGRLTDLHITPDVAQHSVSRYVWRSLFSVPLHPNNIITIPTQDSSWMLFLFMQLRIGQKQNCCSNSCLFTNTNCTYFKIEFCYQAFKVFKRQLLFNVHMPITWPTFPSSNRLNCL